MTTRNLDTETLKNAGIDYAANFLRPTVDNPINPKFAPIAGRGWVMTSLYNLHFKDEFDYLVREVRENLGPKPLKEFDDLASKTFKPRSDDMLKKQLAERLAITPDGKPIPGKIGKVKLGRVVVGWRMKMHTHVRDRDGTKIKVRLPRAEPRLVSGSIHVGETEEEAIIRITKRFQDQGEMVFPLSQWPATMALNTRISNEVALLACDAVVDRLDEGSAGDILQGRSGAQPADPDTAASGTLLFTLPLSDPAFGSAADANPGGRATANAVTNDSSADATATLGYCRASASNDNATSLDDHIDGEAGTSGADFNFNTLSIVSGATVSLTSWTVTMPES